MGYVILLVSFFLEGVLTIIIPTNSFFFPLFSVVSLLISLPFFKSRKSYLIACSGLGLFYDLWTGTLILSCFLFLSWGFLLSLVYEKISAKKFFLFLASFLLLLLHQIVSYFLLVFLGRLPFSWFTLQQGMTHPILLNLFYSGIFFIFLFPKRKSLRFYSTTF